MALPTLVEIARFYTLHGLVPRTDLVRVLPTLLLADGSLELPAARLLLTILGELGPSRFLTMWSAGELDSTLGTARAEQRPLAAEAKARAVQPRALAAVRASRAWRLVGRYYRVRARAGRLARTLRSS